MSDDRREVVLYPGSDPAVPNEPWYGSYAGGRHADWLIVRQPPDPAHGRDAYYWAGWPGLGYPMVDGLVRSRNAEGVIREWSRMHPELRFRIDDSMTWQVEPMKEGATLVPRGDAQRVGAGLHFAPIW